jgi:tRNA nucleotidyltransferase (CCA-adding enzyme)
VSPDLAPDLYEIGFADARGKGRDASADLRAIEELRGRVEAMIAAGAALSAKDLAVNGRDLMRELSLTPGRVVGVLLERLVELVTEDPSANTRERLLEEARRALSEQGGAS